MFNFELKFKINKNKFLFRRLLVRKNLFLGKSSLYDKTVKMGLCVHVCIIFWWGILVSPFWSPAESLANQSVSCWALRQSSAVKISDSG